MRSLLLLLAIGCGNSTPTPAPAPAPAPGLVQRLPWILVGALGMAVMALLAYIVVSA